MATITRTKSGTWKAQVRRIGLPAVNKTFKAKYDAEAWSRSVESEQDRGVFVNRSEADRVTVGELIDRYILEITPLKRSAKNDKQRMLFLKRHFGHFIVSQLQSKHIAAYRDKRLAEGRQGATIVKEIGSMRHLLDVAIKDWGIPLVSNVASLVRKPKQARGRDRRLVEGEEQRLLQACQGSRSTLLAPLVTRQAADSIALNKIGGGAVIIAGSGMCTGGRVRHHLKHSLWKENCSVIFVGFAAHGTLARTIIDGAQSVRIFGEEIQMKAHIHTIGGFSAHADQAELLAWQRQVGKPARTFLVHGEAESMQSFAKHLHGTEVIMPELHNVFDL